MFDGNRAFVAASSRWVFYLLHFSSFVIALYLYPYLQPFAEQYIPEAYAVARLPATWLATYFLALTILPEILCMIWKMVMMGDDSGR